MSPVTHLNGRDSVMTFPQTRPMPFTGIARASAIIYSIPLTLQEVTTQGAPVCRVATLISLLHEAAISKCSDTPRLMQHKALLVNRIQKILQKNKKWGKYSLPSPILNVLPYSKYYCLLHGICLFSSAGYLFLQGTTFPVPPLLQIPRPHSMRGQWTCC